MAAIRVSIFRRTGGKFFQAKWTDPASGRTKQKSTKTNIRREAERFAARLEKELNDRTYFEPTKIKWSEFRERYETEVVPGLSQRSSEKVTTSFNHVANILKPNLLSQVDANGISRIVKELRAQGLEDVSIKGYLAYLKTALQWAASLKLIQEVPVFPKFKRIRETKAMRGRPLTLDEFKLMLAAVPKVCGKKHAFSWRFLLIGLWYSGLRISESLELYWDREDKLSVDFSGKRPMLRIRMEAEKGKRDRLLPIVPEFAALLASVPDDERTGPVFNPIARIKRTERMLASTVSKLVADIGEAAGIVVGDKGNIDKETGERKPRYASAHDLRRSFGERWSLKVMPDVLMLLMRHANIETTLKYYVGRNAQKAAEAVWETVADDSDVLGDTTQNEENPRKTEDNKSIVSKDLEKPPRRVELLTYALRMRCSAN